MYKLFEDSVDTSAVTEAANLREDIGINSIGPLYMAMAVEEEFGIKFQNEDFAGIRPEKVIEIKEYHEFQNIQEYGK